MWLPAKLAHTTLGDIFGLLHRHGASGVLGIVDPRGEEHQVVWRSGLPRSVASEGPRLGQLLEAARGIDARQVASAIAQQRAGDPRLFGEIIAERGVDFGLVVARVKQQAKQRLEQLFGLADGRLSFRAALFADVIDPAWMRSAELSAPLAPEDFLHGRRRNKPRPRDERDERASALRLFGLTERATPQEIRTAFRAKVLELHPDLAAERDRDARTRELARLSAAYQRLTS